MDVADHLAATAAFIEHGGDIDEIEAVERAYGVLL
jgi:hypothetical protein